ncbi:hypothetical protein BT63DRAFT_429842 [Microthyrium microscopicum]|uniref:AMMECR1 domain-containing protein n=1 Tax=Microthyrium microscopicum TaxID=703497 RepID=A0A6A6TW67_9PEZI|nr:hypothetical protein BT63DRAFT_429842 [Microthyrium microscopicum]
MAYPVHCAYCFESISASFDKRKPPSLNSVEELWAEYETRDEPTSAGAPRLPAITRLAAPSSSSVSSAAPSASSSTPSLNTNASSATSVSSDSSGRGGLLGLAGRLTRSKRQGQGQTQKYPLFVTWDTKSRSGNKSLRGCIGTFEAQELEDGLLGYARTS